MSTSTTKKTGEEGKDVLANAGGGETPGGEKVANSQRAEVASVVQTEPAEVKEAGAALLKREDEVGDDLIELGEATHVTLTKDVVEEFYYPDTRRPSFRIKYHAGQVVPRAVVEAHNRTVAARKAVRERDGKPDPKNPAGIDSTTLASGTFPGLQVDQKATAGAK